MNQMNDQPTNHKNTAPTAFNVAFNIWEKLHALQTQFDQMKRTGCYKGTDGQWKFPSWASTEELRIQAFQTFASTATEGEVKEMLGQSE